MGIQGGKMTLKELIKKWEQYREACARFKETSFGEEFQHFHTKKNMASEILEDLKKLEEKE
jgi:hypothetical protein